MEKNKNKSTQILIPRLGLPTAIFIVIGTIIGSGIFKKVAPMTAKLQSPGLVLFCWALAGMVTLFGALTYAEVAGRLAQTGGLYAYLRSMFGKPVGFLFGWACFAVIQSGSIASIAYVFAEALFGLFPFSFYGKIAEKRWAEGFGKNKRFFSFEKKRTHFYFLTLPRAQS